MEETMNPGIINELDRMSDFDVLSIAHAIIGKQRGCSNLSEFLSEDLKQYYFKILREIRTSQKLSSFLAYVDERTSNKSKQLSSKGKKLQRELKKIKH